MKNNLKTSARTMRAMIESGALNSQIMQSCSFTFKSLKGGWYRCNQTGEKTKKPGTYRSQHSGALDGSKMSCLSKVQNIDPRRHYVSVEVSDKAEYMTCPKCGILTPVKDGECTNCGELLDVIILKSVESLYNWMLDEYQVECPCCRNTIKSRERPSKLICSRCNEKFVAN